MPEPITEQDESRCPDCGGEIEDGICTTAFDAAFRLSPPVTDEYIEMFATRRTPEPITQQELEGLRRQTLEEIQEKEMWQMYPEACAYDFLRLLDEVERLRALYEPEGHSRTNPSLRVLRAAWDELPAFMRQYRELQEEVDRLRAELAEREEAP